MEFWNENFPYFKIKYSTLVAIPIMNITFIKIWFVQVYASQIYKNKIDLSVFKKKKKHWKKKKWLKYEAEGSKNGGETSAANGGGLLEIDLYYTHHLINIGGQLA